VPALPAAAGVAKIVVKQTLASVNVYNVLHAYGGNAAGYSGADMSALATAVRSAWVTNVIPLQASTLTLTDVVATDLSSDVGGEGTATGSTNGTGVGTALSSNVAITWSWKIANRYRGGHPRTYIAGCVQSAQTTPNTILASAVTAHAAAAAAIRSAINAVTIGASTWQMGCVSYYKDKALRPDPIFRAFTGVSVDSRLDSQRRRLGRDR
jgi:hypothetical protein